MFYIFAYAKMLSFYLSVCVLFGAHSITCKILSFIFYMFQNGGHYKTKTSPLITYKRPFLQNRMR